MKSQIIICSIIIFLCSIYIYNDIRGLNENFNENLGSMYLYKNDTLKIVDYSLFRGVYILSNGKEINYEEINFKCILNEK